MRKPLATFISVDNTGALVTMRELAQFKLQKVVLSSFKHAEVVERDEVITLRPEEQGTQTLQIGGRYKDVRSTNFFRSFVPTKARHILKK